MTTERLQAEFLEPFPTRMLGDSFLLGLTNIHTDDGGDLTDATATIAIYDSDGATKLSDISMTPVVLTQSVRMNYLLRTGTGFPITAAGTYRAVYKVILSNLVSRQFQQWITIEANPHA